MIVGQPDNAHRAALNILPEQPLRAARPLRLIDGQPALVVAPTGGNHEPDGRIGHRIVQHDRGVAERELALPELLHVHVIHAGRHGGDCLQAGTAPIQHLTVQWHMADPHDAIDLARQLEHFLACGRMAFREDYISPGRGGVESRTLERCKS